MTQGISYLLARQPIFDCQQEVYGYEILYRSGLVNTYDRIDENNASIMKKRNGIMLFYILKNLK